MLSAKHLNQEKVMVNNSSMKRIPTGVSDLDSIIKGGLPVGSVVILLGDVGAGQKEFVYTSMAKLSIVKNKPDASEFYLGTGQKDAKIPQNFLYVTFSRSREDILNEILLSFNRDYYEAVRENIVFKDFSAEYFRHTIVPDKWTSSPQSIFSSGQEEPLLPSLVNYLTENANQSVVVIDSLTDLVVSETIKMHELVLAVKGLQRAAKQWNGLIYLLLATDILSRSRQQTFIDSVDGVFMFEWSKSTKSLKRQRYMYIEKFLSLLPHLEDNRLVRFITSVSAQEGFVVLDRVPV